MPDPAEIQQQIEHTRAELATTVDAIADRVNPKNVAARGIERVKAEVAKVQETRGRSIRWDRVAIVGGVIVLLLIARRRRSH